MDEASVQEAPSTLCCKAPCIRIVALPCTFCENAPSAPEDIVPSPKYCSEECAHSDWPRHEGDCLAARERRGFFDSVKRMQRSYYNACDIGLEFAMRNGYKVGTKDYYHRENLQQRWHLVSGNERSSKNIWRALAATTQFCWSWISLQVIFEVSE